MSQRFVHLIQAANKLRWKFNVKYNFKVLKLETRRDDEIMGMKQVGAGFLRLTRTLVTLASFKANQN